MGRHALLFSFFFITMLMAGGCKKDDAIQQQSVTKITQTTITAINGPVAGSVGQELTFHLIWEATDSLARFNHLQDSAVGDTRHIKLFVATNSAIDGKTAINESNTVPYTFKAPAPGIYYLKFYKQNDTGKTTITDTLIIK